MNSEEKTLRGMLYKTDGTREPVILRPKSRLEQLQKLVGGLIEIVYLYKEGEDEKGNDLVINEEGLLLELPANPFSFFVAKKTRWERQIFFGDIVLVEGTLP